MQACTKTKRVPLQTEQCSIAQRTPPRALPEQQNRPQINFRNWQFHDCILDLQMKIHNDVQVKSYCRTPLWSYIKNTCWSRITIALSSVSSRKRWSGCDSEIFSSEGRLLFAKLVTRFYFHQNKECCFPPRPFHWHRHTKGLWALYSVQRCKVPNCLRRQQDISVFLDRDNIRQRLCERERERERWRESWRGGGGDTVHYFSILSIELSGGTEYLILQNFSHFRIPFTVLNSQTRWPNLGRAVAHNRQSDFDLCYCQFHGLKLAVA